MKSNSIITLQSYGARLFIKLARSVFSLFFSKRIMIAHENVRRSSLQPDYQGAKAQVLIQESLNHLALTVYHSILRGFGVRQNIFQKESQLNSDINSVLRKQGILLESSIDLDSLLNQDRALIFMSAHIGAWEELIHLGTVLNRESYVLSRQMKIPIFQRLWDRSRKHFLPRIDQVKGTDQSERARFIIKLLKRKGAIADVLDQHSASKKAVHCEFLGRVAATSTDLSRYAFSCDAMIIPIFLIRACEIDTHKYRLFILAPIDPRSYLNQGLKRSESVFNMTQTCTNRISEIITQYPEQWMWIHRRWKLD